MLVKENLQIELERAIYEIAGKVYTGKPDKGTRDFAKRLSEVLTDYIKTSTVTIDLNTGTGTIE